MCLIDTGGDMRRSIIAIGIFVLAVGCGSKKQAGDADADDATDVTAETDAVVDPAPEPEPDGTVDPATDPVPDAEEDTEEDVEPDAEPDVEEDAGEDAGEDPEEDGGTDAGTDSTDAGSEPTACHRLDPTAYGMCDMVLGVGWDGSACVWISGCSCSPDCAYFFTDMTSCMAACP
jgi:hypothetical protein